MTHSSTELEEANIDMLLWNGESLSVITDAFWMLVSVLSVLHVFCF